MCVCVCLSLSHSKFWLSEVSANYTACVLGKLENHSKWDRSYALSSLPTMHSAPHQHGTKHAFRKVCVTIHHSENIAMQKNIRSQNN